MPFGLASNFLVPSATLVVLAGAAVVVSVLLVLWPLVDAALRAQWGYVLGVLVLGPIGGLLWWVVGRRETRLPVTARPRSI